MQEESSKKKFLIKKKKNQADYLRVNSVICQIIYEVNFTYWSLWEFEFKEQDTYCL